MTDVLAHLADPTFKWALKVSRVKPTSPTPTQDSSVQSRWLASVPCSLYRPTLWRDIAMLVR